MPGCEPPGRLRLPDAPAKGERRGGAPPGRLRALELVKLRSDLAGFAPLSPEELQAPSEALRRGGFALLYPASLERVLETRPIFRWEEGPRVAEREVRLSLRDGKVLWMTVSRGAPLAYPPEQAALEPGGA